MGPRTLSGTLGFDIRLAVHSLTADNRVSADLDLPRRVAKHKPQITGPA